MRKRRTPGNVRLASALVPAFIAAMLILNGARAEGQTKGDEGLEAAIRAHYAAMQKGDTRAAGTWLTPDFFYIAPWGALEFRDELLARMEKAFAEGQLKDYRIEVRGMHSGPAGSGGRWFRAIVREKYLRESGRKARNAFAEDLLTSGVGVQERGGWRIRYLHQTWSEETLRVMIPILHAAQPVDPEEY